MFDKVHAHSFVGLKTKDGFTKLISGDTIDIAI